VRTSPGYPQSKQAGALAQIAKIRVHPARHTTDPARCAALDLNLRRSLQRCAFAQRHRLCDGVRYARRTASRVPRRPRSQAGTSVSPAAAPAGGNIDPCRFSEHDCNDLARRNGSGLCRDATMLRNNLVEFIKPMPSSPRADPLALCTSTQANASDDRFPCHENPCPVGTDTSRTENANSPSQAEPAQPRDTRDSGSWDCCSSLKWNVDLRNAYGYRHSKIRRALLAVRLCGFSPMRFRTEILN